MPCPRQVDKAGGNITVATGCAYPCDRVYQGLGLTGYTNATRKPLTPHLSQPHASGNVNCTHVTQITLWEPGAYKLSLTMCLKGISVTQA